VKGRDGLNKLRYLACGLEVVIIDRDRNEKNSIWKTNYQQTINSWILTSSQILKDGARIGVYKKGRIKQMYSKEFFRIDSSNWWSQAQEWVKNGVFLVGENHPRHLTLYIIEKFFGNKSGLHNPFYGSVFVAYDAHETTLAHEIGHAILWYNAKHTNSDGYLMAPSPEQRMKGLPPGKSPRITLGERCIMRRSRWLDWSGREVAGASAAAVAVAGASIVILFSPTGEEKLFYQYLYEIFLELFFPNVNP